MRIAKLIKYISTGIFCIIFLSFLSCKSSVNEELQKAELLINNKPDSAFHLLTHMRGHYSGMNDSEKALFGYLYSRAGDGKGHKDSSDVNKVDFSIDYYTNHIDKQRLAECYLYKARIYKDKLECPEAINNLLKAKDIVEPLSNHKILAEIYFDLGHIYSLYKEQDKALDYLNLSIKSYEQYGNTEASGKVNLVISWLYSSFQNYDMALQHTKKALSLIKDPLTTGDLLENIGDYHLAKEEYDSAHYYYQKSLLYPEDKSDRATCYYGLAKLFFQISQYDSSKRYIDKALSGSIDIAYKANCYRLLASIASETGTKQEQEQYVAQYQIYQDSVNKRKKQPDIEVVEKIYQSEAEKTDIKNQRAWLIAGIIIILSAGCFIFFYLYKRNKKKQQAVNFYKNKHSESHLLYNQSQEEVNIYKTELKKKHNLLLTGLKQELEITKEKYAGKRKKASSAQDREDIDKAVYNEVLHIDNEPAFIEKMNQVLNDLPQKLQNDYPDITYKQIVWCCLFVLEIFTTDIALILDYTSSSLYTFKQRLSKKLNFNNVKEFEQMLYEKMDL